MARAEKPEILKWICRQTFDKPLDIKNLLARGAVEALGKSVEDAESYAEANADIFWRYLLTHEQEFGKRGVTRCFEVIDSSAQTLAWFGAGTAPPAKPSPQMRSLARLRHRPAFLKMIDDLSDREYEALGCVVSKLGGATETKLTPRGGDGGIDFFAQVENPSRCHLFGGGVHPLRIIGQCKKYSSPVVVDKVDAFITTIEGVKYRTPKAKKAEPPEWFLSARGPIIGLIIAHSGFQSGASDKAKNHGIIAADSMDLAEIAARSRKVPESLGAEGRALWCRTEAIAHLQAIAANLLDPP